MNENQLPEPTAGGRYVRNGDGTLTQIHKTEPAAGRVQRAAAEAPAPAQPAAGLSGGDANETPKE